MPAVPDHALVDELAERLELRIRAGEYAIGTWLRQGALATEFGVSRTPVREALRKLQADRLVEVFPHRGALVRGPSASELCETFQIRGDLEGLAAELAAERATEEQIARLRGAETELRAGFAQLHDLASAGAAVRPGVGPWADADVAFRDAILAAAGVARLAQIATDLRAELPSALAWSALAEEPSLLDEGLAQRARVRAAIERRDAPAARRWMTDHCRRTGALVAEWFERRAPTPG